MLIRKHLISEEEKQKLLELGIIDLEKVKLKQIKITRDEAKSKNDQAKGLESQVSVELKKRGKNHEEQ